MRGPCCLAALVALLSAAPAPAQVKPIPTRPMDPGSAREEWKPGKADRRLCIDTAGIAGAIVIDPRRLEIYDRAGRRFQLTFAEDCPHLSYYGGFYYRADDAGQICASRDALMGRAGGSCRIRAIAPMRRVR
ncbi:MAG: hypothetical protein SNJ63_00885 [Sphingomonadaceae bacterium]